MEFLGVNLPQMTVLIHESVSHTACVAVPNACSPLKILALKGRGRRRERLPPSSSNTCTRTGTIDQASNRARRKRARGRPATDLFSNSQSVLRTPPPPKKRRRVVRKEGGEIPLKAKGEPLPMNGRKEELVNGFSRHNAVKIRFYKMVSASS